VKFSDLAHEYLAGAGLIVGFFLLLHNPSATNTVISALSKANTNAITALEGNTSGVSGF
jgi:hypothetical protein